MKKLIKWLREPVDEDTQEFLLIVIFPMGLMAILGIVFMLLGIFGLL